MEKALLTSIDDMTFSRGGTFWVVFIRQRPGRCFSLGSRAERGQYEDTALVLRSADEWIVWVRRTRRKGIF